VRRSSSANARKASAVTIPGICSSHPLHRPDHGWADPRGLLLGRREVLRPCCGLTPTVTRRWKRRTAGCCPRCSRSPSRRTS